LIEKFENFELVVFSDFAESGNRGGSRFSSGEYTIADRKIGTEILQLGYKTDITI
jgi:hypothetical protein